MIFRNKSIRRLLAAVMAVVTCFALALAPAAAEEDPAVQSEVTAGEELNKVMADQQEGQTPEGEETQTEETETEETEETETEETEPVEELPAVTEEEFLAAWDLMIAQLDDETKEFHAEAFKTIVDASADYAREDALTAVNNCAQALADRKTVEVDLLQILDRLNADTQLEEGEKNAFAAYFENGLAKLEQDPVSELLMSLTAITPEAEIVTPEIDAYLQEMEALGAMAQNVHALMDNYSLWQETEAELANLAGYAMTGDVQEMYQALAAKLEELKAAKATFLDLTAEEQMAVVADLSLLAEDAAVFHEQVTMVNNGLIQALEARIQALEARLAKVSGKLLFAYVALAIGIAALIVSIVATVCALRKPKDETIDVSALATRKAAETLNEQNVILMNRMRQMDEKVDILARELKKRPEPKPEAPKPEVKPEAPKPKVEEKYMGSNKEVCRLTLCYQTVNPANSFLQQDDNGKYVLYDDNTLALREEKMHTIMEFKGWKNNGLLYLFDAQVDGTVLNADRDALPSGYFETIKMVERAQVTQTGTGCYNLKNRGIISMKG